MTVTPDKMVASLACRSHRSDRGKLGPWKLVKGPTSLGGIKRAGRLAAAVPPVVGAQGAHGALPCVLDRWHGRALKFEPGCRLVSAN